MTLIRQVFSDLFKEIGWIILYGFLAAMTIMTFILIGLSYKHVSGQNSAINRFVKNNVYMVQIKSCELNTQQTAVSDDSMLSYAEPPGEPQQNGADAFIEYFENEFSSEGVLGSYVSIPYSGNGFSNLIIYVGKYADLTRFSRPAGKSTVIAVSTDRKDMVGETIQLSTEKFTIDAAVPDNMDIYHPYYYAPAGSLELENTLYVFTDSYALINKLFPQASGDALLERLIAVNPTEQELIELRGILYRTTGMYAGIQSVSSYLASVEASGTRTHQTYLLFYISSSIALIGAMLLNMTRALNFMRPAYSIHHLFGASGKYVFMRMHLFTVGYNIIPFVGILTIMSKNMLLSFGNISILTLALLAITLTITTIKYRQFRINFSQGLRRE